MPKTARLELRIETDLMTEIDAARGDVPRSVWVTRAIEARLAAPPPRAAAQRPAFNRVKDLRR